MGLVHCTVTRAKLKTFPQQFFLQSISANNKIIITCIFCLFICTSILSQGRFLHPDTKHLRVVHPQVKNKTKKHWVHQIFPLMYLQEKCTIITAFSSPFRHLQLPHTSHSNCPTPAIFTHIYIYIYMFYIYICYVSFLPSQLRALTSSCVTFLMCHQTWQKFLEQIGCIWKRTSMQTDWTPCCVVWVS